MKSNIANRLASVAIATSVLGITSHASAYNEETHQRIVEAAIEAMLDAANAPIPAGFDATTWKFYTQRLVDASDSLKKLHTGLSGVWAYSTVSGPPNPDAPTSPFFNVALFCNYFGSNEDGRDLNLLRIPEMRIEQFPYYPNKEWTTCAYGKPTEDLLGGSLGPVLGWHAQSVDARLDDSVVWLRPTNWGAVGLVKEAANRVLESALGAAVLPIVCLANAIFGSGCDIDDAFDFAQRLNPVTLIEGILPGGGNMRDSDYVGLWHFIDVEAHTNRYNDVRGMFYEKAGPSHPGAVDITIMALSDVLGLSLNAFVAEGPERYGYFDRVGRTVGQWQAHTIGHTEFSPLDNLARDDWGGYLSHPTDASFLQGPLHAVGDAAAPHHVTGTTSWGHRPFEDAVNDIRAQLLPRKTQETFEPFRDRVLRTAFDTLQAFDADGSIQAFIEREARATRSLAMAEDDWVFQDGASVTWHLGDRSGGERSYRDQPSRSAPFVELGVAYAIALLTRAGEIAKDPGGSPDILCPELTHFTGEGTGCGPGLPPPPPVPETVLFGPLSCLSTGQPCQQSTECCSPATCAAGTCQEAPPPCRGSGESCHESAECCNGAPCSGGACQPPDQCLPRGAACHTAADCCSHDCRSGECQASVN